MDKWISQEYERFYVNIKRHVDEISKKNKGIGYFTPHDSKHCNAVEKIVKELVEKSNSELNDLERFILLAAVWTHDLGMYKEVVVKSFNENLTDNEIREKHDETSAYYLKNYFNEIFGVKKSSDDVEEAAEIKRIEKFLNTINIISKYHRRKEDIDECPQVRFINNVRINTKLLACFLRLGDTLHVDLSRFDRKWYDILQIGNFDRKARLHWLKSYVVSNVYIDSKKQTIFINIDLPELKSIEDDFVEYNIDEIKKGYDNLAIFIEEDIYENVIDINDIFREYDLLTYSKVESNINYVVGYNKKDKEEIFGIINDLEIILSSNDSSVIKKTFDSIKSLYKIEFDNYENFYKYTEQLINNLETISAKRTCHVGLRTIIKELNLIFDVFEKKNFNNVNKEQIKKNQDIIKDFITNMEKQIKEWENEVYKDCNKHLDGIQHIFLAGFSSMVSKFIFNCAQNNKYFLDNLNIYVLEFGGRRRFLHHNFIDYNDGVNYSLHLKKMGFANVKLLPDTSFPSLLHDKKDILKEIDEKNCITLFGANGVDTNGNCWHSSGHLMVAIISHSFKIPVKVVANKFKIGEVEEKSSALRETKWLTGQKNVLKELNSNKIQLINYLEDKIPKDLISEIITNQI